MNQLVVYFRLKSAAVRSTGGDLVSVVEALVSSARARGGRVVAWDVASFAFGFPQDALPAAVDLVTGSRTAESVLASFSVGISEGEVEQLVDGGAGVGLALGPGLARSVALARVARAGEVLVDPLLGAVTTGELLTRGSRLGTSGRQRVRGLLLDLQHPWRRGVAVSPSRLVQPEIVGRPTLRMGIDPGHVGVLVAGRGLGGTRYLHDFALALPATLRVAPPPLGEPLGALRRAIVRAHLAGYEASLAGEHASSLESLLAGEGLDGEASSALVAAWLGRAPERYVLVDDAGQVDADTLESVAGACHNYGLRILARVDEQGDLPPAFADLPRAFEIKLAALPSEDTARLAEAFTAVTRIARRGGQTPLGIVEALREGLESGDLAWRHDSVAPRSRHTAQGDTHSAAHWMFRRLRFFDSAVRAALDALCVLGGEAPRDELAELLRRLDVEVQLDAAVGALEQGCWVQVVGGELVALTSATLCSLLERVMAPDRHASWHQAAAQLFSESERPLDAGPATLHALQAADLGLAQMLARRAAASVRAAGLIQTAGAFDRVATGPDLDGLMARGLTGGRGREELLEPTTLPRTSIVATSTQPGDVADALGVEGDEPAASTVMAALHEGKFDEVERLTAQLRVDLRQGLLADRLDAMAQVARGESGEALRLLRESKTRSTGLSAAERCRAALAHGVGLAAAGRHTEALLEALEGLARAREAGDVRGEQACARFLAQLASVAGKPETGARWASVASS
jgi:hypothetical protein